MLTDAKKDVLVDALSLFIQSKGHQHYTLADLTPYVVYPNKYDKLRVFYEEGEPIGLVTWAWLTPDRAEQFRLGLADLTEKDYKAEKADKLQFWGIDFISPYGKARKIMSEIRKESRERYGAVSVKFRRLKNPTKEHTQRLI